MIDYALAQRLFKKHKAALTRAKNSGSPAKVIAAVRAFEAEFSHHNLPLPDSWSMWERAKEDAIYAQARGQSNPRRRNPETEVTELVLYITNDGDLYRRQAQPIIANLAKKMRKGAYDATKALKLWGYLADAGAQKYTKEYDSSPRTSFGAFSKADRVAAAKELADSYAEELAEAAGTRSNPRHRRIKMARRKKSRRRSGTNRGSVRVVRFRTRGGRVKIVRFHKAGTKAAKRGSAKKKAHGRALARKYKLVWKGKSGSKRVFLRMPGGRLKKIRQPHR